MLGFIISIIIFCFIVWGIPLIFLKKTPPIAHIKEGFCNTHMVITIKNAEESIEGIVRSLAWQISNKSNFPTDVYIVDLASTDQTFLISEKLAEEYTFIHPVSMADYIAFLNNLV